jgi:pyruvate/2-oxoglutarate dehydrogenase complex dihydrolipoamide acyltransferase (E2) component
MHACIVACAGKITKKPVVRDGEVVIREMMTIVYTVDHRFGDAAILV